MEKAKYALLALCAYLALVGMLALTAPRTAHTQGKGGPDVRVVNTAAEPVPVTLQGTAQFDAANPIPVRDIENPARQPVEFTLRAFGPQITYTVPDGKRLVIEYASGSGSLDTGVLTSMVVDSAGSPVGHRFPLTLRHETATGKLYTMAETTRLYFDAGEVVEMGHEGTVTTGATFVATFSGYLIDVP